MTEDRKSKGNKLNSWLNQHKSSVWANHWAAFALTLALLTIELHWYWPSHWYFYFWTPLPFALPLISGHLNGTSDFNSTEVTMELKLTQFYLHLTLALQTGTDVTSAVVANRGAGRDLGTWGISHQWSPYSRVHFCGSGQLKESTKTGKSIGKNDSLSPVSLHTHIQTFLGLFWLRRK